MNTFTLNPSQTKVWLSQTQWSESPLQNNTYAFFLGTGIETTRFLQAHDTLVESSESLRCRLKITNRQVAQTYSEDFQQACEVHDLSHLSSSLLTIWLDEFATTLLNLQKTTWRAALIKTSSQEWIWVILQHHLASDRWSFQLYLELLDKIYNQTNPSRLNTPLFTKTLSQNQESSTEIDTAPPALPNRFYAGHTSPNSPLGSRLSIATKDWHPHLQHLQSDDQFVAFSRELTTLQLLATSLFALLYRLHNRDQITIAVVFQNRRSKEEKQTSGMLVELRPLSVNISPEDSFLSLYQKTRTALLDTISQNAPSLTDSCDTVLNCITGSFGTFRGNPIEGHWLYPGSHDPTHQLRVHYHEYNTEQSPKLLLDTNNDSFPSDHQNRLSTHLSQTLASFAQDPESLITSFPLLDSNAQREATISPTLEATPTHHSIIEKFLTTARNHPQSQAIKDDLGSLTYHQLTTSALSIASLLSQKNLAPSSTIAIFIAHNRYFPLASLGALAHGSSYLPLDPETPHARLEEILHDAEVTTILTTSDLVEKLPHSIATIAIDTLPLSDTLPEQTFPIPQNSCAYLLYTSGSTGKPNGVRVQHLSVLALLADMEKRVPSPDQACCSWWTQSTFDVSVYEIYSALLSGHTLCIPSENIRLNSQLFFPWLTENNITNTYLPPYYISPYLSYSKEGNLTPPLRRMLVGVEPLDEALLAELTRQHRNLTIINGYGPTEATICSTFYKIDPTLTQSRRAPLGRPTAGNRIHLLDSNFEPVPKGAIGEIFISGSGLAESYQNRPQLTQERFLTHLSSSHLTDRYYRTGDLARLRDDEQLEFIGRVDSQLKVNGLRIDPSEIERAASTFPNLLASVAVKEVTTDSERLALYFQGSSTLSLSALHAHLSDYLPAAMIPRHFIQLEEIPLTENGKLIRNSPALQRCAQNDTSPHSNNLTQGPTNDVERMLVDIWKQTLKLPTVSVELSFFQLGGTSIAAMDTMQRICQLFDLQLPLQTLFKTPTIRDLAHLITTTIEEEIAALSDEEAQSLEESLSF